MNAIVVGANKQRNISDHKLKCLDSINSVCLLPSHTATYLHYSTGIVFCDLFSKMRCDYVVNLESFSLQYNECHCNYCSDDVKQGYSTSLV